MRYGIFARVDVFSHKSMFGTMLYGSKLVILREQLARRGRTVNNLFHSSRQVFLPSFVPGGAVGPHEVDHVFGMSIAENVVGPQQTNAACRHWLPNHEREFPSLRSLDQLTD